MSSWKEYKLEDVLDALIDYRGKTPTKTSSGIPLITAKIIKNGRLEKANEFIAIEDYYKWMTRGFPKIGDILLTTEAPLGEVAQLDNDKVALAQRVVTLRGKANLLNNDFLLYLLQSKYIQEQLEARSSGSTVKGIKQSELKKLVVKFPELEEQIVIANQLKSLDNKIQLNTQINQTLEQIAQAIFKSWFIDFDPVKAKAEAKAQGSTDEQADIAAMSVISGKSPDQLNAYKQTNPTDYQQLHQLAQAFPSEFEEIDGVDVPKGWGIEKIEGVIQKIPVGKKYSQKNVFEEGDIPVLDQGKSGIIGYHNDKAGVSASTDNPVIVFANHTCYMRLISYPFSAIQNVFAFKGKEVDVFWLYLATLGKQEFTEYKGHFPDFLIKQIVVPNKEMTFLFSQFISENFMKIFSNDEENKQLSKLRDLLLPKLLSGDVGV